MAEKKKSIGRVAVTRERLLRDLAGDGPPAPVYLIYGEEAYLLRHTLLAFQRKADPQGIGADLRIADLDGKGNIDFEALRDELQTPPFLSQQRMVILKNSGWFNGNRYHEALTDLLTHIPERASLVLAERKVDGRYRKIYKAIEDVGGVITQINRQSERDLMRWVAAYFNRDKIRITTAACESLVQRAEQSMNLLIREMKKLKLYAQAEEIEAVTLTQVEAICIPDLQGSIFSLGDCIVDGDPQQALEIFRRLLEKREPIQLLLLMLGRLFRRLYIARLCDFDQQRLAEALEERRPFILRRILRQSRAYTTEQLRELILLAAKTDEAVKGGSSLNPEFLLENLILTATEGARVTGVRR